MPGQRARAYSSADLTKPAVERLVLRPDRYLAAAHQRLVLANGRRQRREAPLRDVALAYRIQLSSSFHHGDRSHR
jgi:hypothetical protein